MVWHPIVVKSSEHFEKVVEEAAEKPVIVYFWSADDREHRTREDVMHALKQNSDWSMRSRFGEIVQLEVNADKFPAVLDVFDICVTPSFLAIRQGQVVDENIGFCKEYPVHKHFDPKFGERSLHSQVKEFYYSNVPRPPGGGLFGSSSEPQHIVKTRSEGTCSGTERLSGKVQWGALRDEGPSNPPPSFFSPHTSTQTTLSAEEEKGMLEAAANTITEDPPEYSSALFLEPSPAATEEIDEDLQRALDLSLQASVLHVVPLTSYKGKERETSAS